MADVKTLSPAELPEALKKAFVTLYAIETNIDTLKAKHIKPLADEKTALWRDLKAKANIDRKDLDLFYKLFKRTQDAKAMDEAEDGERIQQNLRRAFTALQKGQTLDFLDALGDLQSDMPDMLANEDSDGTGAEALDDLVDGDVPLEVLDEEQLADGENGGQRAQADDAEPALESAASDWQASTETEEERDAALMRAGTVYTEGETAGLNGVAPEANPYAAGTIDARNWEQGRAKGFVAFKQKLDNELTEATWAGNRAGEADEPRDSNPFSQDEQPQHFEAWDKGWEGGQTCRTNLAKQGGNVVDLTIPEALDRRGKKKAPEFDAAAEGAAIASELDATATTAAAVH